MIEKFLYDEQYKKNKERGENILDFFNKLKEKDKLLHTPSPIPETAKDTYGDISTAPKQQAVVERKPSDVPPPELPSGEDKAPVKFVDKTIESAGLQRDAGAPKQFTPPSQPHPTPASTPATSLTHPTPTPSLTHPAPTIATSTAPSASPAISTSQPTLASTIHPKPESAVIEPPAFENIPLPSNPSEGIPTQPEPSAPEMPNLEKTELKEEFRPYYHDDGFFRDFQKFLNNNEINDELISNVINKDLLHKMKQFHIVREDGNPFFFHPEDSSRELVQKLEELKLLEEEWYIRHKSMKESEALVLEKEADIDLKLEEFKGVLQHIKQREKLEKKAPMENYFNLEDGGVLRSIGDLRDALKTMKDRLYNAHITNKRNDFATWVEFVFGDKVLADQMRAAPSRKELLELLYSF